MTGIGEGRFTLRLARGAAVHEAVPAGTTGLVWSLPAPRSIAGRVCDSEGRGVADRFVKLFREGLRARSGQDPGVADTYSDANGRFEFANFRDGTYVVVVLHPTLACEPVRGVRAGDANVELQLTAGCEVRGVVTDAAGSPVSNTWVGATLDLVEGFRFARQTSSDAQGRFTLTGLVEGDYTLDASLTGEGSSPVFLSGRAKTVRAGSTDVRIVLAPKR